MGFARITLFGFCFMACEVKSFRRQKWGKERRQKEKSLLYSLKKVRIKHLKRLSTKEREDILIQFVKKSNKFWED